MKTSKEKATEATAQAVREAAAASAKAVIDAATAATSIANTAMSVDISYIKTDIKEIKDSLKEAANKMVTVSDFTEHLKADADHETRIRALESKTDENALVKKLVFGCVTIILAAVITSIIYLVVNK